jgi:hypothetical protein
MAEQNYSLHERRSFLTRISAGMTAFAASFVGGAAVAQAQTPAAGHFQPARHDKDDWLDQIPGSKHRIVFDTVNPDSLGDGLAFANNFLRTNRSDYNLQNNDMAVLIIARHRATSLGYNDKMWEKYGKYLSARAEFVDPKSKEAPKSNIFNSAEYDRLLPNRGNTLDNLLKQGAVFGVCAVATRGVAGVIAEATSQKTDDVVAEIAANLISPTQARLVPAGIIAVNRAQERGYSLVSP